MKEKSSYMFLLKYLQDNTDMDHKVSMPVLREESKKAGYTSDPRTIRKQISTMQEAGYDIMDETKKGVPAKYFYGARDWERADVRILIDAVASAMFISNDKTEKLIKKLSTLAGRHLQEELTPKAYVSAHVKAENEQIFYIIDRITEAIQQGKKISFKMQNYNTDKERIERRGGQLYKVSPYDTVWCDDRYYMIGWSDDRNQIVHMRIDRMTMPEIQEEDAVPKPDSYNVQDYAAKITRMLGGAVREVTIRCRTRLVDNVIDKFGLDVPFTNITKDTFDVTVEVAVSGTFLSWLFQYAGNMMIIGPEDARKLYFEMLEAARDDLLAGVMTSEEKPVWRLLDEKDKEKNEPERDKTMEQKKSRLGAVIAAKRNLKGWSQEQLAEMTGIDVEMIRKAETEPVWELDDQTIQLLADTLKLDYDYLLGLKGDPEAERFFYIPGRGKGFPTREELEETKKMMLVFFDMSFADLEGSDGIDESGIY